jgi:inorganic pyrophosphatase
MPTTRISAPFTLKFVLTADMTFPVDFGFVPSTLAADGDPLDAIVLLDESLAVGTKLTTRLVGAIKAREREKDGKWERNDRLITAATHAHTYAEAHSIGDVDAGLLATFRTFFERYNSLHGKEFKVDGEIDRSEAKRLIKKAAKAFAAGQS